MFERTEFHETVLSNTFGWAKHFSHFIELEGYFLCSEQPAYVSWADESSPQYTLSSLILSSPLHCGLSCNFYASSSPNKILCIMLLFPVCVTRHFHLIPVIFGEEYRLQPPHYPTCSTRLYLLSLRPNTPPDILLSHILNPHSPSMWETTFDTWY